MILYFSAISQIFHQSSTSSLFSPPLKALEDDGNGKVVLRFSHHWASTCLTKVEYLSSKNGLTTRGDNSCVSALFPLKNLVIVCHPTWCGPLADSGFIVIQHKIKRMTKSVKFAEIRPSHYNH